MTTSPSEPRRTKQVIVMRTDLNMRKGKMVAQGSHACLAAYMRIRKFAENFPERWGHWTEPLDAWLDNSFTKICVGVDTEAELLRIHDLTLQTGIPNYLITDNGATEFNGVPTRTCLAVGPWWSDELDPITGKLRLL